MATMDEDTQQPLITNELSSTVTNIPGENMNVVDATPDGGSAADRLAAEDDDSSPILPNDEVPSSVDDPIRSSDHNESSAASAAAPGGEELESLEEFVSAPNSKQETETADAMAEFVIPPPVVVEKPRNFLGLRLGRGKHHSTTSSASSIAPTNDDEEKEKSKETDAKNKQDEESESQDEEEEDDDESDSDSLGGSDEEDNDDEEEEEEEDQESAEQDLMIPQKRWGIPFRRNNGIDSNDPNQSSEEEEEEEEFWTDMGLNEYDPEQVEERMLEEEEEEDAAQFRGEEKQPNKELEALLGMKFNLRLWWYPFACWQMETRQREWCVNKEDGADKVAVEKCDRGGQDDWEFERIPGNRGFVQIRKYSRSGRTEPQCWEAHDRSSTKETRFSISLKTCDSNKTAQHWKIDFDSDIKYKKHHPQDEVKFEIQARNSFMMKEPCCVSQGHHPKADERMDCQTCSKPRSLKHQSSFWEAIRIKEADRV
uniref:Uncharacterized protein n=1 Tax=Attheya septentrionalis TaxID=420275 RepID=A0A7S2UMK8_9STRA|mmetsp:Transcript_493/g.831  ORF Transcript_493/g.831 Transcript_493/m.831 type:complete len:483 (+) Transcript_493:38-1486(+)